MHEGMRQMSREANTLKDNQTRRHNRHTDEHTQAWAEHPQVYTPLGAHTGAPGDTPTGGGRRGEGTGAPGAHGWTPGARRRSACACPTVRVATCGRRGAHCARGCRAGAARGERLPWRTERGRILMGRPQALPSNPPGSLLPPHPPSPLKSPRPAASARAPHSDRLSPLPGA